MGLSELTGSPFWLVTVLFYLVAWIVSLAGLAAQESAITGSSGGLSWFILILGAGLVVSLIMTICAGSAATYRNAFLILTLLVTVFDLIFADTARGNISGVLTNVSGFRSAAQAYLAGNIMQLVSLFLWIIFIGSNADGMPAYLNDFTMHNGRGNSAQNNGMQGGDLENGNNNGAMHISGPQISGGDAAIAMRSVNSPQQGKGKRESRPTTPLNSQGGGGLPLATPQAPLLARALYTYKANAEDPNEMSFDKGEMLEIIDNRGKWWQVKRKDGKGVAIAPSNYLQLVS